MKINRIKIYTVIYCLVSLTIGLGAYVYANKETLMQEALAKLPPEQRDAAAIGIAMVDGLRPENKENCEYNCARLLNNLINLQMNGQMAEYYKNHPQKSNKSASYKVSNEDKKAMKEILAKLPDTCKKQCNDKYGE